MWKKLKNLFKKKEPELKAKTLEEVLKKIPAKANETKEQIKKRVKINKRIRDAKQQMYQSYL
tara:strand:- start:1227 stop:1412 length:186 start_codon:yes stop_codon:yes gene_type:complete